MSLTQPAADCTGATLCMIDSRTRRLSIIIAVRFVNSLLVFGRRHLFGLWRVFSSGRDSPFGVAYLHSGRSFEIVLFIDIF